MEESLPVKTTNFANSSLIPNNIFFPEITNIAYPDAYRWTFLPFLSKNFRNLKIRKEMQKNNWPEELVKEEISAFLAFDNQLLMFRLFKQIRIAYEGNNSPKPFTIFSTGSGSNFHQKDMAFLDKILYERPNLRKTLSGYEYPRTQVGIQGIYNVFKFLLSQDTEFADLIKNDRIYVPVEVMRTIADEMVYNLRQRERQAMNLGKTKSNSN